MRGSTRQAALSGRLNGDFAELRGEVGASPRSNRIFLYGSEYTSVLHRVIEASGGGPNREFITKGDGNNAEDPQPVRAEALTGEVPFYIPKLGYVGLGVKEIIAKASGILAAVGLDFR